MNVIMVWAWMLWSSDAGEHDLFRGLCMAVEHDSYCCLRCSGVHEGMLPYRILLLLHSAHIWL